MYVKLLTVRLARSTSVIVLYIHVLIHLGLYIMHTNATSINLVTVSSVLYHVPQATYIRTLSTHIRDGNVDTQNVQKYYE